MSFEFQKYISSTPKDPVLENNVVFERFTGAYFPPVSSDPAILPPLSVSFTPSPWDYSDTISILSPATVCQLIYITHSLQLGPYHVATDI